MTRLSKIMVERGLCSRRKADEWIAKGWVRANGQRPVLGEKFLNDVKIEIAVEASSEQSRQVTILLHKPIGFVSAQPEKEYRPAIQLLTFDNAWSNGPTPAEIGSHSPPPLDLAGLAVAGRLDIDSSGLLIFTQDGRIAKQLIGDFSEIEKEYLVRVEGDIDEDAFTRIENGLVTPDHHFRPAFAEWLNDHQLRIVLREGKKRQIRKMCEAIGLHVTGLKRVRVGRITLGALPLGQWRYLADDESFD